jgi:hypothetical protein
MRQLLTLAVSTGALAAAACAQSPAVPAATSAERFAAPATAVQPETGYSEEARHIADCLVRYRSYDYRTDTFRARSGATRPCAP